MTTTHTHTTQELADLATASNEEINKVASENGSITALYAVIILTIGTITFIAASSVIAPVLGAIGLLG